MNDGELIPTRESLLARLKDCDDHASWREFFHIYWRLLYSRARKASMNDAEAQDVVQDIFVSIARRMPGFRYDPKLASFKTWLYQVSRRRIADHFRRRGRELPLCAMPQTGTGTAPMDRFADTADSAFDAAWDEEWEENLRAAAMDRVRRKAGPEQFQIFEYHVVRGRTVKETTRDLNVTATRVYLAKHRIARMLKGEIARLRARTL